MKKIITMLLALCMMASTVACSSGDNESSSVSDSNFDAVSDGNNITRSKPAPEVFLKAAEYLGLSPETCLVVEDAVSGVEAAHRAGMKAAALGDAAKTGVGEWKLPSFSALMTL